MSTFISIADILVAAAVIPIAAAAPIGLGWAAVHLVCGVRRGNLGISPPVAIMAALCCGAGALAWLSIDLRIIAALLRGAA